MPKTHSPSSSTPLPRRRWTAEEAKQVLSALDQSGLSPRAFAEREGLDAQRLWRWRRKLATPAASAAAPPFEEIVARDTASTVDREATSADKPQPFEIVLGSGRVLRVPASFDAGALRQLLTLVDEVRPC